MIRDTNYTEFLTRYYHDTILELAGEYPDRLTLVVDFQHLDNYDIDGAERLLNKPDSELKNILSALKEYDFPGEPLDGAIISIKNLPTCELSPIYEIGSEHVNKLIAVEGRISKQGPKKNKLLKGAFKCQRCSEVTSLVQPDDKYIEPFECDNEVCGRKGPFKLIHDESIFVDEQKLEIQDLNETLKPGQPVRDIIAVLRGKDLIANIPAIGTQVVVTGIVRTVHKKDSSLFDNYLEVLHVEPREAEIDLTISAADKKEFQKLAANGDIIQTLVDSTAPEILGYAHVKAALLCAIVSGSDNPQFREYIHLILCGDPGTGKTALLKFIRALVPRAQYSAGRGSTVAGLTVSVIKDELSGSGYTAQAGALVLADKGLLVLDESDKLESEDLQALNTALEESFIEIHKGGLNQKFNTRCSVIALCNPKDIRFENYEPLVKQIAIPADTLSRFDLIFIIQDIPDQLKDRAIAEHQARQWARHEGSSQGDQPGSRIAQGELGKYLEYAKTIRPRTNPETRKAIVDYYLTLRNTDQTEAIRITARDNNGLYRLTKAMAKLRLSDECILEDVTRAIDIHQVSREALIDIDSGGVDIDLMFGSSKSQRDRMRNVREIILELQKSDGNAAYFEDIVSSAKVKDITKNQIEDILKRLKRQGEICEVKDSFYRVMV